ncbi:unnamed protein product [Effrenium voratum]|nr:unnamed protein product [Effrenium voratum]
MCLKYHRTFIDEETVPVDVKTRSQSWPPVRREAAGEELARQQLATLAERAAELQKPPQMRSPHHHHHHHHQNNGSRGHPELCRRPCVYFAKMGKCAEGDACAFCHLSHPSRSASLDKKMRELVAGLQEVDLLAILLPQFQERLGSGPFLRLLEEEFAIRAQESPQHPKEHKKLESVLQRMSLSTLFGLLSSKYFSGSLSRFAEIALEDLRASWTEGGEQVIG